jgi:magnesium-dependent phosphatase 1
LNDRKIDIAIASRTHSPGIAIQLLELFGVRKYFQYEEIYPGSKIRYFEMLCKHTGIPYTDMFFFDDEYRNIVDDGLSKSEIRTIPGFENI